MSGTVHSLGIELDSPELGEPDFSKQATKEQG